ncbi:Rpn family recombination-promoting nuclease/putative transposase [Candidatus Magnetobacterium casense]|uniref:Rpn family recombination-promoting nuclease/putative transposase n=1 Tax=Candidatus Magnetobacterium casense TaxID=1455061 RepID=A0ABS6RWJ3_9BACT|nr:Rpn family recombination-promoting nuclease/putative transposase [Candidatus Magnetobacterium casensis]MBV6340993.1 Rpn family recombination-promoting nuclease/putative transposase [Candidatus Magnetobacterium casensis]
MRFVDVKSDIAFKRIFGNENKKGILISFLNAVLDLSGEREIYDIDILNPYQVPKIEGLKETVLDIRAVDKSNVTFIVEIQIQKKKGFEKRVLYYTSKAYANQLDRGKAYSELKQVIYIAIVDFEVFDGDGYLTRHLILNTATLKQDLKDFEFYFIELPKFTKAENELESITDKWIHFIKNAYSLEMVPKCADFVEIKEAYEIANESTWSKKEFEVYEYWQIRLQDERGAIENSFDEGKIKGIIEGRVEGRLEGLAEGQRKGLIEGQRKGLLEGIEGMLEIKYASETAALMDVVMALEGVEQLQIFNALLRKSASVDELWAYLKGG